MIKIDRIGKRYGRLVVTKQGYSKIEKTRTRNYWFCKCDCGGFAVISSDSLSKTKSCGCIKKEQIASLNYKHGEARKTKENKAWWGMKDRCYNPNSLKYNQYGGRGIVVCDRWLNSYENFIIDMGRAPTTKHSIDRINVDGNYEPDNCRWLDSKGQANNTTRNVFIEYSGERMTIKQWSEKLKTPYKQFHYNITKGKKTIYDYLK